MLTESLFFNFLSIGRGWERILERRNVYCAERPSASTTGRRHCFIVRATINRTGHSPSALSSPGRIHRTIAIFIQFSYVEQFSQR